MDALGEPLSYDELLAFIEGLLGAEVSVTFGGLTSAGATLVAGIPGRLMVAEPDFDPVDFAGLHTPHGSAPPVFYLHGGQEAGYYPSLVVSRELFEQARWIIEPDSAAVWIGGIVITVSRNARED